MRSGLTSSVDVLGLDSTDHAGATSTGYSCSKTDLASIGAFAISAVALPVILAGLVVLGITGGALAGWITLGIGGGLLGLSLVLSLCVYSSFAKARDKLS